MSDITETPVAADPSPAAAEDDTAGTRGESRSNVGMIAHDGATWPVFVLWVLLASTDGVDGWLVQHIQAPGEAARLVEKGRELFGTPSWVAVLLGQNLRRSHKS